MHTTTPLSCTCGAVRLEVHQDPIIASECHCTSCRTAGRRLEALPSAPRFREEHGGTPFVLYRKDRVRFLVGQEQLRELRLTPDSPTRRVVASCCNSPMFLEFQQGHWLSLYASLWPDDSRPAMALRTMTMDVPAEVTLDDALPNLKRQSGTFFMKLLGAWLAMGLRVPKVTVGTEPLADDALSAG